MKNDKSGYTSSTCNSSSWLNKVDWALQKRKSPISEKQSATDILKKEKKKPAFPFSQHIGRAQNVH